MPKMKIRVKESDIEFQNAETHKGAELIGVKNGAKNGFCFGISYYHAEEFSHPGIHEDQDRFCQKNPYRIRRRDMFWQHDMVLQDNKALFPEGRRA